jgi:Ca2+:H+ antiporter
MEPPITVQSSLWHIATDILFFNLAAVVLVPIGMISKIYDWGDVQIFAFNFLAIIPLAKLLDYATDQLAMQVGDTLGGLLNATFGNAVELVLGILALRQGLIRVVQASLIGSMLSNMLLVLGFCFLLAGVIPYHQDKYILFNRDAANLSGGMLTLIVLGFIIPAGLGPLTSKEDHLMFSRG